MSKRRKDSEVGKLLSSEPVVPKKRKPVLTDPVEPVGEPLEESNPKPESKAGRKAAIENPVRTVAFISQEARDAIYDIQQHFGRKGEPNTLGYAIDQAILHFRDKVVE